MRFEKYSRKTELRKRNFPQIDEKETNRNSKKTAKAFPGKAYPVGMKAVTSRITRFYKKKPKTIFETEKWKNRREVRRRYPGPRHSITP